MDTDPIFLLLWTVPAVAVVVALSLVLASMRRLEEAGGELAVQVRRLGELRPGLVALRREMERSGPAVEAVERHWHRPD